MQGGGRVIAECEHSGSAASLDQFIEVRFVNRKTACFEQLDSFRVTIDAENMMFDGCQTTTGDQAYVATANDANLQGSLSGEAPHCMTISLVSLEGNRDERRVVQRTTPEKVCLRC